MLEIIRLAKSHNMKEFKLFTLNCYFIMEAEELCWLLRMEAAVLSKRSSINIDIDIDIKIKVCDRVE